MTDGNQKTGDKYLAEYREKQTTFDRQCWERWGPAFDRCDWVLLQAQNIAIYVARQWAGPSPSSRRQLSCFRRGQLLITVRLVQGRVLSLGHFLPKP
jgi:hypothetical protein